VHGRDAWWDMKERRRRGEPEPEPEPLRPIHMPKSSGVPFILSFAFFVAGFGFVFNWYVLSVIGLLTVAVCLFLRSFDYDTEYYIPVDEIQHQEAALGRA
jgi:cytochrome aa3-600 menaquinol oxidase subunit 1